MIRRRLKRAACVNSVHPEGYPKCPALFSPHRFARTCSRCSRPPVLATTQNDLATGNKVNSALDNPTNYFTAQSPEQPRQRHQQPSRRHRQRRAGAAGRQHRHHLAAVAGRQREVDRQPGAADHGRLFDPVERLHHHRRRHRVEPAAAPPPSTARPPTATSSIAAPPAALPLRCRARRSAAPQAVSTGAAVNDNQATRGRDHRRHPDRRRHRPR